MVKRFSFISLFLFLLFLQIKAQNCAVEMDALKGKYEGDCKNGKAEGKGKATGTEDVYEGEFKSGLPDGIGEYTWKNGSSFFGKWYRGKKEGEGLMMYKLSSKDSIVNGFWKKDVYTGKYEKPYVLYSKTRHIARFSCRKENGLFNQIDINLTSESAGNGTSMSGLNLEKTPETEGNENTILPVVSKPQISNIQVTNGNYERKTESDNSTKKIIYTLENVTFPFRAQINMGSDFVDVEFFEPGKWFVEITLAY